MKAVRLDRRDPAQLHYEDCPTPAPLNDQALIKLKAAAVNRIDMEVRGAPGDELPRIPGADGAGLVETVGAHVHGLKPGDAVCLFPFSDCGICRCCIGSQKSPCREFDLLGSRAAGTYAEYVCVPARNAFPIPAGLSFEQAAALPLVHLMAWRMLIRDAELKPGEWVMIVGAGGGIATAALQLATAVGARVIVASRSEQKLSAAEQLGAIHGISLRESDPFRAARVLTGKRGADVVVNCVGGESWAGSLAVLARGGRLVTCGALCGRAPRSDLRRIFWNHLRISGAHSATRAEFARVLSFFSARRLKPVIDSVFPLSEVDKAQARLRGGGQFGKIVLRIEESI